MRNILIFTISLAILCGAYSYTFGLPAIVAPYLGGAEDSSAKAAPAAGGGRPGPGGRRGGGGATTVVLAPLEAQSYTATLRTVGSAKSLRSVAVISSVSGQVVDTRPASQPMVKAGDVIAQLDDTVEQLELEIGLAERDQAQATFDRYDTLGRQTVAGATIQEAEVALRLAEANVGLAQDAVDERIIRAPIAGRIGLTDLTVGDYLQSGETIATVVDTSSIVAEFEVPERSIAFLEVGRSVTIGTPTYAGRTFTGEITEFDANLDDVTRSATVRAEIDNSEGLLLPGMTFAVRLSQDYDPMPTVPATALTWDRSGAGIWIATEGKVSRHPATIRYRDGNTLWIDTDVDLGAMVVTEGAAKLREGATVVDASQPRGGQNGN
ncbi:efflux RND transporter periplasmic adaptor subunit [Sagittula sp. SSi028]|uniref:efflux RND transporter periplasmic adaptor subunit n=1 Tax=Sagittula sp. SSi028 TaxID=3400636 RepID=UPI003AF792D7